MAPNSTTLGFKMNKSSKSRKPVSTRRKKTIPQSEEELSDRRSTSSSDSALEKKLTITNAQNQRTTRTNLKKRKSDTYQSDDITQLTATNSEWLDKGSTGENSNDSDPAWNPKGKVPTAAKQRLVERKSARFHSVPSKDVVKNESQITPEVNNTADNILKPSADPDGLLCFAALISATDATLEKGFESGQFIMLKSDLKTQKSPCIWRIDGKNLLQKYEPIIRNNSPAYRNISTYSSWMATNKGLYVPIEVEFVVQSKSETIVTFDRTKVLLPVQSAILESLNEEFTAMVDPFQIYLQTLISQSLDGNFLNEIIRENDTYFIESIAGVENLWILPKRDSLKDTLKLRKSFQELLETYPTLELRCVTSGDKSCDACNGKNPTRSFDFQPLTYNFDTLETLEGKAPTKTYRLCLSCTDRVVLYHQLFHVRYELYKICQAKIKGYELSDVPAAITACLDDHEWKSLMHRKVFLMLAEAQQIVCQFSSNGSTNS